MSGKITLNTSQQTIADSHWKRIAIPVALIGLAIALRLHGIATESFWTDEALTVQCSEGSIVQVLDFNAQETRPPLYYVGLRLWRDVFGDSDARIRAYSTAWSLVGLLALFLLARDLGGRRAAVIALLLAAVNPLDIYFAQEARNYSQTAALCMLGSWCLWRWITTPAESSQSARGWQWAVGYTICAAAASMTHYLSVVILVAQGVFALALFGRQKRWARFGAYLGCALAVILAFLPWFFYVQAVRKGFSVSTPDWMPLPPVRSFFSFLGREFFWGHTSVVHNRGWIPTMVLPGFVLFMALWQVCRRRSGSSPHSGEAKPLGIAYPIWLLAAPVFLAASASFLYHPIYFRPRFSQLVLAPFLILGGIACASLRNRAAMWLMATTLATVMLAGTIVQRCTIQKPDWRSFAETWRKQGPPAHAVFFPWHLIKPAGYYLKEPLTLATKDNLEKLLPYLQGAEVWICSETGYNYGSQESEADFYQWLTRLGSLRNIPLPTSLRLEAVTIGEYSVPEPYRKRFDRWYGPIDRRGKIEGFGDPLRFHALEFDPDGTAFRWSLPKAWLQLDDSDNVDTVVLRVQLPPLLPIYRPDLRFYAMRSEDSSGLFDSSPVVMIAEYRSSAFEVQLRPPQGHGRLWIGWRMASVNLWRAGVSGDGRDLGLRINWAGVINHPNKE